MESFAGQLAVITGGGTGMGRELVRKLSAEGCHVAMCDVSAQNMAETAELAAKEAPAGTTVTSFVADVSDETALLAFRDHVAAEHAAASGDGGHIDLLFNNAGIGGSGSMIADDRGRWEKTFGVCWGGVYLGTRTFLPMLVRSERGHLVNTSSVSGLWASVGPTTPHTSYSAAKFAVRGFTEALITDCSINAPHVSVHLVMPGHIGTSIVLNSAAAHGNSAGEMTGEDLAGVRAQAGDMGMDLTSVSDDDLRKFVKVRGEMFRDNAPMTAEAAAQVILDGVRAGEWRILVGEDAKVLDELVRSRPAEAYSDRFYADMARSGGLQFGG